VTGSLPPTGDSKPVPDPTVLTTEQLHREISALREFVLGEIHHVREISHTKFEAAKDAVWSETAASDKAIAKSEAAIAKQIDALTVQMDKSGDARDERINDLRDRVRTLETIKTTTGERGGKSLAIAAIAISALLLLVTVVIAANTLTST
jgi:hypothetical protein